MSSPRDLCFTSATELVKLYRARKASPLEVMQEILSRIDAVNPDVNAIVTLVRDAALRDARRATAALRRRWPRACVPSRKAPISAARSGGRRPTVGSSGSGRHPG